MLRIEHALDDIKYLSLVRTMFAEYACELNVDLCFQNFNAELDHPFKKYGHPAGTILIAFYNDEPAACVALQKMKRYVRNEAVICKACIPQVWHRRSTR